MDGLLGEGEVGGVGLLRGGVGVMGLFRRIP